MKTVRCAPYTALSVLIAGLSLTFLVAPTPGDIGGCGQRAELLDAVAFFKSKAFIDCQKCGECGLMQREVCQLACDLTQPVAQAFPDHCYPLVHDGEVCLRALANASCSDYNLYMHEQPASRSTPSECNFCPLHP